jgi:hypothetical protein
MIGDLTMRRFTPDEAVAIMRAAGLETIEHAGGDSGRARKT